MSILSPTKNREMVNKYSIINETLKVIGSTPICLEFVKFGKVHLP